MRWKIPEKWLYRLALLLAVPALLINLGLIAFIDDEGIRTLVAMEMDFSGNYIVPTINGEYYYNKPPLYNWILLVFFKIFGDYSEWSARFPTVFFLCAYAGMIYVFFKKKYGQKIAFINAFALITCGRILFWDSMLGLIDICFSAVMFANFLWIYHQYEKQDYTKLYFGSWFLTVLGFLMKGLPALVFQGFTILAWLIYNKRFKKLFLPSHFLAGGLFLMLVGGYYFIYHQYNDLSAVFSALFTESAKRTVVQYSWGETFGHLFSFPFEQCYHFLPWTLMVFYFFRKGIFTLLQADRFISYCALVFVANIPIYWTSPEVYPRYLLMLLPLLFAVLIHLHFEYKTSYPLYPKINRYLLLGLSSIIFLGAFVPFFLAMLHDISYWWLKAIAIVLVLGLVLYSFYNDIKNTLLHLVLVLLILRIGFNWFVLPQRNEEDFGNLIRQESIRLGQAYKDKPLFLYKDNDLQRTNSYYITRERGAILKRAYSKFSPQSAYLINRAISPSVKGITIDSIPVRHRATIQEVVVFEYKEE